MNLLNEKNELPGGVHPSGLVVVAFIFLLGYWIATHKQSTGTSFTSEDIGAGGGIRPFGWNGDYFLTPDDMEHEKHFQKVFYGREPAYHQPDVLRDHKRSNFYDYIRQYGYNIRHKPYLEKRSFPG